jgi:hypothetical protein
VKLISSVEAAKLLQVHHTTLYRKETPDGDWCVIYGHRLRVHTVGIGPGSKRRYNEAEVRALVKNLWE